MRKAGLADDITVTRDDWHPPRLVMFRGYLLRGPSEAVVERASKWLITYALKNLNCSDFNMETEEYSVVQPMLYGSVGPSIKAGKRTWIAGVVVAGVSY